MLITLSSAAGQGFYKIFCPGSKSVCSSNSVHEANFFVIKYLHVLHSTIYASHGIGHSGQWIITYSGEMCERFYIYHRFEAKKTIDSLKVNMANNVTTLLFYILTWASLIFFRLLLNLICN